MWIDLKDIVLSETSKTQKDSTKSHRTCTGSLEEVPEESKSQRMENGGLLLGHGKLLFNVQFQFCKMESVEWVVIHVPSEYILCTLKNAYADKFHYVYLTTIK
jgi:hypothetical protein